MTVVIRKSVRVLLLNEEDELLLMCIRGYDISTLDGTRNEILWCTIGGEVEKEESIEQTALREIYEESGINPEDVTVGPAVWYGSVELLLKGKHTRFDETYIVAKTKRKEVALSSPTDDEKRIVKQLKWFSLEGIKGSKDPIFPQRLSHYLPDILAEKYPSKPIRIDLKGK